MFRPRRLDRPSDRPQRLPTALDRDRRQPQLPGHPGRDFPAGPQPSVRRRLPQAIPQLFDHVLGQDRRARPVAPPQVTQRIRTLGMVARQQLLDPPHAKGGHGGHLRDLMTLRQEPNRLKMPRRPGIRCRAHPLFQSPKAQVRHHMRHACPPRSRPTATYPPRHGAQRPAERIIRKAYEPVGSRGNARPRSAAATAFLSGCHDRGPPVCRLRPDGWCRRPPRLGRAGAPPHAAGVGAAKPRRSPPIFGVGSSC